MTNTLIHGIIDALSGSVSKEVIVFLISMIPILELRGALLVAGPILGVKVSTAIPLCIIGNIIPGGHLVSAVPGRTRRRWRESSANVGFLPWLFTAMRMESSRRNVIVRLSG